MKTIQFTTTQDHFILNHKVILTIPTLKQDKTEIENIENVKTFVLIEFSKLFGGATMFKAFGAYQHKNKSIALEKVYKVESFFKELDEVKLGKVFELALKLKNDLDQESVMLTINDQTTFI